MELYDYYLVEVAVTEELRPDGTIIRTETTTKTKCDKNTNGIIEKRPNLLYRMLKCAFEAGESYANAAIYNSEHSTSDLDVWVSASFEQFIANIE